MQNPTVSEIMTTFDFLYPIYKEVETVKIETASENKNEFVFGKNSYKLPQNRSVAIKSKEINVTVRHSLIQEKLYNSLVEKYGAENVAVEQYIGMNRIDVVARDGQDYIFYEVKVANSARDCIREALGQIMDY